jgi:hypothetical protein
LNKYFCIIPAIDGDQIIDATNFTSMKKFIITALAAAMTLTSFPQETSNVPAEKNVLKMNTLSLFLGTGSVFYERRFSDLISGQLGLAYMNIKLLETKFNGLILTPEIRFYPRNNSINGFYMAPYLRYTNFGVENKNVPANGSLISMGGGFVFGRQWITRSGFTMDLFFGGHYSKAHVKVDSGGSDSFNKNLFDGFSMRAGFALGFAF